jgi:hypothetical protein
MLASFRAAAQLAASQEQPSPEKVGSKQTRNSVCWCKSCVRATGGGGSPTPPTSIPTNFRLLPPWAFGQSADTAAIRACSLTAKNIRSERPVSIQPYSLLWHDDWWTGKDLKGNGSSSLEVLRPTEKNHVNLSQNGSESQPRFEPATSRTRI